MGRLRLIECRGVLLRLLREWDDILTVSSLSVGGGEIDGQHADVGELRGLRCGVGQDGRLGRVGRRR